MQFFAPKTQKASKPVKPKPIRKKRVCPFRLTLPITFKKQLIMVYYGSCTDFDSPHMSISQICHIFGIRPKTMQTILSCFRKQGKDITRFVDQRTLNPSLQSFTKEMTDYLIDQTTLQSWAGKGLRERALLATNKFGVNVSVNSLWKFYHMNNVSFRNVQKVYRTSLIRKPQLEMEREQFALKLGHLIRNGAPVIYCDESSFNNWSLDNKSWSTSELFIELPYNKRHYSVTLFASIATCLKDGFVLNLAKSTNKEDFLLHLKSVKKAMRDSTLKPYIVLDNASAHHSLFVKNYLESQLRPLWLPAYSPQL